MIEISLLKSLSIRHLFDRFRDLINNKSLSNQSLQILKDYADYFTQEDKDCIDFGEFSTYFFNVRNPYLDEKTIVEYKEIFRRIDEAPLNTSTMNLIVGFEKQELLEEVKSLINNNTDLDHIIDKLNGFNNQYKKGVIELLNVDMDIDQALEYTDRSKGLKWRLPQLQAHFCGGLIKGDLGVIAGYTDSGKTSFLASELSYMAEQLEGDQYILWLNNEGSWKKIFNRIYCATLDCTRDDLMLHREKAKVKYKEKMHGDSNRIRVVDIQGKHTKEMEQLFKHRPPALVVFDMLDHLRGFEKYISSDGGSFERYCKLYHWALDMSAEYCPVLVTSQLNRNGNDNMYPAITELRGSGVDKQSAATFVLVIGMLTGENTTRYLSTPKFKVTEDKSWRAQVNFDPSKSRFY